MTTTTIPHRDPDNPDDLVQVTYWDAEAVADMFGMSTNAVRARCRRHTWPHLPLPGRSDRRRYWFNAAHIDEIRQRLNVDADEAAHLPQPVRLGLIVDPDDLEAIGD